MIREYNKKWECKYVYKGIMISIWLTLYGYWEEEQD